MEELKYCRACLVTDVRMYSLDITSNDSIGLIYSHLAQIRICDRNQHVCFECASLLRKYQVFKSKCLRAHNILSSITVNSTEITKEIIRNIDRKEKKLESNLILSTTSVCSETFTNRIHEDYEKITIKIKECENTGISEVQIKTVMQITGTNENKDHKREKSDNLIKEDPMKLATETISTETTIKSKTKESKSRKRKILNELPVIVKDEKLDFDKSSDDFIDNDIVESPEENVSTEISTHKRKTRGKEPRTKRKKIETVVNSEDNLSDDEPLSKCAAKISDKKIVEPPTKTSLNLEFFDDYATVIFLTPDDAKKELLSRKESSNYKRSPFKCDFCYKGYEAKAAFENHMKKHGKEYGDYECDLCHLRFPKHIYLCKHRLSCHKRKFSCKLCPYVCYCMYQARTHVSLHKGKKYPCKDCNEIFSMPNSLLMHKRVKHMDETVSESVCELCGNTFGSPRGLFLHSMKLHRTDKNNKQGPKCEECAVHFSSEVAWKRHLVLSSKHSVINGCKYCGEIFKSTDELKSHKRAHHPRVKQKLSHNKKLPSACDLCDKWLTNFVQYNTHMNTEHPLSDETMKLSAKDLTPFVCEVCGQTFKQQCFLTYHQRKHTGERPYSCDDCGKTFVMAGALSVHRTVHSRKRNYKCHLCQRVFSFKSALNKHIKAHLGIRPHKCTICEKGFLHMCDLKLHIKYVHDKVPWPKKKSKRNVDDNNTYLEYNDA